VATPIVPSRPSCNCRASSSSPGRPAIATEPIMIPPSLSRLLHRPQVYTTISRNLLVVLVQLANRSQAGPESP
jgi:hypothetical protein